MGRGRNGKWGMEAGPVVQAKLSGGLYRELWEPSHLSVDPRNKWDFKFGPLIST